ncbi:hypothetical protein BC830DRAFT_258049 [Chytriomyces sp. MP71]|nr:hypothetical protein BC830DRAFT_258049 [Chytriomyces sp. MP71]
MAGNASGATATVVSSAPTNASEAKTPKPLHHQCSLAPYASAQELNAARVAFFNKNVSLALEAMQEEKDANPAYSPPPTTAFISPQDQLLVCRVYETRIAIYIKTFKLDESVHATAVSLFKRFYLRQALFNHDPRHILLASIFLAAKAENSYLPLADFLVKVPAASRPSQEAMWDKELVVADVCGFQFGAGAGGGGGGHVHWPLHGLFLDLQLTPSKTKQTYYTNLHTPLGAKQTLEDARAGKEKLKQALTLLVALYTRAKELATLSICSDLSLTHWSSQIALGCFRLAATEQGPEARAEMDRYISFRITWVDTDTLVGLHAKLDEVAEALVAQAEFEKMAKDGKSAVSVKAKEINARLQGCLNPEFLEDSKLHEKRKRAEEEAKEAKRQKKMKKEKASMDALENVFI